MKKKFLLLGVILSTYLYGIAYLPFRGEEANRFLTAYEMAYFHDYFNPTHLGEPYYLKPPLFMDVEILFAHILGWHWWIGRLVSIVSVFLTAWLVYRMALELFGFDRKTAFVAAVILLTLGDIAVFYGFLGEIDAFHMFIFTLGVYLFYKFLKRNQPLLAFSLAGFVAALQFLTKGFPALYHIPVSVLTVLFFENSLRLLFTPYPLAGFLSFFIPLAIWYLNLHNPEAYLKGLWSESFRRIEETDRVVKTVKHLLTYPLLTFKQLLPYSAVLLFVFFSRELKSRFAEILKNRQLLLLTALTLINYLPYWLSPGGRGRYALVVFPFVALLIAKILTDTLQKPVGSRWVNLLPAALLILSAVPFFLHPQFFLTYEPLQLLLLIPLTLLVLYLSISPNGKISLLTLLVSLVLVFKVGFVNFAAPYKEKKNPAREIALALAPAIPPDTEIKYLPKKIYMELCAYTDAFTRSIVLRKTDSPIVLTDKKNLPRGCKVERENRGWVVAVCGLPKGNNQPSSIAQ